MNSETRMNETTLTDIIEQNRRLSPTAPALIDNQIVLTWEGFVGRVELTRCALANSDIHRGDRVAIIERPCIDFVVLHYALAGLGAIMVPVNIYWHADEIRHLLEDAQPKLFIVGETFLSAARQALQDCEVRCELIVRGTAALNGGETEWNVFASRTQEVEEARPNSWNDAHLLLYTSGATGRPKGALISQRRTVLDGVSAVAAFGVRPRWRFLNYLPMFHTGAWDYIKQYFLVGGSVVIMDHFEPGVAIDLLQRHRCDAVFGVPLVLRQILQHPSFATSDMSALKLLAYGSYDPSQVMEEAIAGFTRQGATELEVAQAYGLTEAGPFVTILRPEDSRRTLSSVGTPPPGVIVELLDENLIPVAKGSVGEICVRSAALMDGYWRNTEGTCEAFRGDWLHTGDLGRFDDEGLLYVVDRIKDMIRTAGENVYAKEVEQVLVQHPAIADCAVIGLPDEEYDERVVAVVVVRLGASVTEEEIIEFARARIAHFKAPREVRIVPDIPKTAAGKTMKNELRRIQRERTQVEGERQSSKS